MDNFFATQIKLIGNKKHENLAKKSIAIIGCGGLGNSVGLYLGSCGLKKIYLLDFDRVELSNISRQIAFKKSDLGKNKAEVLAKRIKERGGESEIICFCESFEEFSKRDEKVDLIIDATDNFETRVQIDKYSKEKKIPWIFGSVDGFEGQVCLFWNASFEFFLGKAPPLRGVLPPMVGVVASFEAILAMRYLAGFEVEKDTFFYLFFTQNGAFEMKKFKVT